MARCTAALILAMSLNVGSLRTLACEWVCEASTPVPASKDCQDGSHAAVDAQWSGAHICDQGVAAETSLGVAGRSADRLATAFLVIDVSFRGHFVRAAINSLVALPPGALLPSSTRAAPVLRI